MHHPAQQIGEEDNEPIMPVLRRIYDSATGTYHDVEVSHEVYNCYHRTGRIIQRNDSQFYDHEIQFTSLLGDSNGAFQHFREFLASELDPEYVLCRDIPGQTLFNALAQLTAAECYLLQAIILDGYSERGFAQRTGLTQKTVHNRKTRALRKLKRHLIQHASTC